MSQTDWHHTPPEGFERFRRIRLITYARAQRPDLHIIARAYDRTQAYRQFRAGASDIVREMFDSSLRAGRYVLENMGLTDFEAAEAERLFFAHDREGLKELAALWDPNVPPGQNKAYVARSKELHADLETAILNRLVTEEQKKA